MIWWKTSDGIKMWKYWLQEKLQISEDSGELSRWKHWAKQVSSRPINMASKHFHLATVLLNHVEFYNFHAFSS